MKHTMKKSELEKLQVIIQEKLITKGVSNKSMREIANELGIDTGLVVKVKQKMNPNMYKKDPIPVPDIISTTVKTPSEVSNSDSKKDIDLIERKRIQLNQIRYKAITAEKHFLTKEEKDNLVKDYLSGKYSQKDLAILYEVCIATVANILKKANVEKKGKTMAKRKKITTKRSRDQNKKSNVSTSNANVVIDNTTKNENCIYAIVKFVLSIPVYEENLINQKNIIWAISKNRSIQDLREDLHILNKEDMRKINELRSKYYLVSFVNNKMQLIDFFNVSNKEIIPFAQQTTVLYKNEDGIISNEQIAEAIKMIIRYDRSVDRTRLRSNDFVFDHANFTNLQKVFGFDRFSFNLASKNNSVTVEAGLVGDRHNMPVEKFIYPEALTQELMFNYPEQERIACDFIKANFNFEEDDNKIKVLKLYITGMQCAFAAVMKVCTEMKINLVAMHYNNTTGAYVPQYIVGNPEETGAYVKGFERIISQKSLNGEILLFNCTYEDFSGTNVDGFYIMEAAKMRNTNSSDNQKEESIIVIIKRKEDIWKLYPTLLDHLLDNTGLNLALWVTTARIKDNVLQWGMNIVKSFNYK